MNAKTSSTVTVPLQSKSAAQTLSVAAMVVSAGHDPYAAGVEMNYCKRREPTGRVEYPNVTKRNDWAMHRVLNPRPPKTLIV